MLIFILRCIFQFEPYVLMLPQIPFPYTWNLFLVTLCYSLIVCFFIFMIFMMTVIFLVYVYVYLSILLFVMRDVLPVCTIVKFEWYRNRSLQGIGVMLLYSLIFVITIHILAPFFVDGHFLTISFRTAIRIFNELLSWVDTSYSFNFNFLYFLNFFFFEFICIYNCIKRGFIVKGLPKESVLFWRILLLVCLSIIFYILIFFTVLFLIFGNITFVFVSITPVQFWTSAFTWLYYIYFRTAKYLVKFFRGGYENR